MSLCILGSDVYFLLMVLCTSLHLPRYYNYRIGVSRPFFPCCGLPSSLSLLLFQHFQRINECTSLLFVCKESGHADRFQGSAKERRPNLIASTPGPRCVSCTGGDHHSAVPSSKKPCFLHLLVDFLAIQDTKLCPTVSAGQGRVRK